MRHIAKTALESNVLERWVRNNPAPSNSVQATQQWKDFGKKTIVRNQLLSQQRGLCAYTEIQVAEFCQETQSKHGCHIEHIKPKELFPEFTFDYHNLLISLLSGQDLSLELLDERHFAGHSRKNNEYDEELFIAPTKTDCQRYFCYLEETGEVVPASGLNDLEANRAEFTIGQLNLNHHFLCNRRLNRINEVVAEIDELEDDQLIAELIANELQVWDGKLASFPSVISSLS